MITKKVEKALNAQVNAEFWSGYLYLAMSVHFAAQGNKGVANWFQVQFREEQDHARILMDHILARGGKVTLAPVAGVKTEWSSPVEAFQDTLEHEKKVTGLIENLCNVAAAEKDFATSNMLIWFVNEQIEEEENVHEILQSLDMIGGDKLGLYMIDKELAGRSYTTPAPLSGKK